MVDFVTYLTLAMEHLNNVAAGLEQDVLSIFEQSGPTARCSERVRSSCLEKA